MCGADDAVPAGALFPVGDANALALTLQRLIRDPVARAELAAAGARRAKMYDWEVVADRVEAVYDAAVGGEAVAR